MGTPTYKGRGQPAGDSGGFLGGLGSWLGGSPPTYAGKGQPSGTSAYGGAPAYAPAPVKEAKADAVTLDGSIGPDQVALVIPRDLIERQCSSDEDED